MADTYALAYRIVDALMNTALGTGYRLEVRAHGNDGEISMGGWNRDAAAKEVQRILSSEPPGKRDRLIFE